MIAFICNKCHMPLDINDEDNIHLEIRCGERGITSKGQYGNGWGADLCGKCAKELEQYINEYYYIGGKYVIKNKNAG